MIGKRVAVHKFGVGEGTYIDGFLNADAAVHSRQVYKSHWPYLTQSASRFEAA